MTNFTGEILVLLRSPVGVEFPCGGRGHFLLESSSGRIVFNSELNMFCSVHNDFNYMFCTEWKTTSVSCSVEAIRTWIFIFWTVNSRIRLGRMFCRLDNNFRCNTANKGFMFKSLTIKNNQPHVAYIRQQ